ncbi:MAG TPA: SUMF1/EgtB/PvdO family nonheme iron enzyme, partial [Gemmatimonadota bacterium]|nr:SUMF1/EgtB/PvdO family nonheme iron enzyme [Gemmatimonadota bacterium]
MPETKRHRTLWQVLGLYAAGSWVCLQVVDVLAENIPLPSWVFLLTLVLLVIGLPITAATAYFQGSFSGRSRPFDGRQTLTRRLLTWGNVVRGGVAALAVWGLAVTGWLVFGPGEVSEWEVVAGLEEIDRLTGGSEYAAAYALAADLDRRIRSDSVRVEIWGRVARPLTLETDPPGARVFRRDYAPADAPWRELGKTPLTVERFPLGVARLRFERSGHRTREVAGSPAQITGLGVIALDADDALPPGMARIPGGSGAFGYGLFAPGLEQAPVVEIPDFLMAVHEVTNRAYQAFVDSGGYEDPRCWRHPFVEGDDTLSFTAAMERFRDSTGRPGPRTWDAGRYPPGSADHPVGGVSWYEAEAYACFVEMALPTVYHWYAAADPFSSPHVVPLSNFGGESAPVGEHDGVSHHGIYDLAGNVREWTRNANDDSRFILGGGWSDLEYAFNDAVTAPAFDRSPLNGIRLVQYTDTTNLAAASAPLDLAFRDYRAERPVSDEVFQVYRQIYAYDPTPLNAEVLAVDSAEIWVRERVELDAGYGGERLTAFLYLPRGRAGPHQTVVYFPGSGVIYRQSYDDVSIDRVDFLVRSGRAVLLPIYKGTFERGTDLRSDIQNDSNGYRDHVIAWSKDLRRSVDYLATRDDIDLDRLAYLGVSWGGAMAPIMTVLEERIRANVILVGGLMMQDVQPVADPFHFLPRVRQPTLMLSARWDSFYPLETSQRPLFENLGT